MLKTSLVVLAAAGALFLAAPPSAQAAPRAAAQAGMTQDFSAVVVRSKTVVRRRGAVRTRTVVRTYPAPKYYGYYGPTVYERPYARPRPVVFGVGGWW